jgi:hypothetical protein
VTKLFALAVLFWAGSATMATAADTDYSAVSLAELIDELTIIDSAAPGILPTGDFDAFIVDDAPATFTMGLLGAPTPTAPPQMRELVRRGVSALPLLFSHLDDRRPTHLAVRQLEWGYFGEEYDPRVKPPGRFRFKPVDFAYMQSHGLHREYVVKVGDVCFALIGQIVNRRLWPVRYQPSGGLIINSPIESPSLAEQVSADWRGLDATHHRDSLVADIAAADQFFMFAPALARLRFYYPAAYHSLSGRDLEKRTAFETGNRAFKPAP